MSLMHLARTALSMPLHVAVKKAAQLTGRRLKNQMISRLMRYQSTYPPPPGPLTPRLTTLKLFPQAAALHELARRARLHEFDLLGSGWVRVNRGEAYAGFNGHTYGGASKLPAKWREVVVGEATPGNQPHAAYLLNLIDDPAYRPMDWHVDFKSGYRWPSRVWGASTAYAHKPGVDVKVPWELARLQHLPWLALDSNPVNAREFRNQVLDFLAANPPGWGVNWACAMDVAIRAANLVLAWDLFRAKGIRFDNVFEEELAATLLAHGRHIAHHLEWNPRHRGNHYLADISGLAFIACALPRSTETDLWLAFATQQLDAEILRQFSPDGANFEASTAYHRLSAEMALFTVALILGLPEDRSKALTEYDAKLWTLSPGLAPAPMAWPPFGPTTLERLARAARFAMDITKPSGEIVQIGDNDSGRFFKLSPSLGELDILHVAEAAMGLFDLGTSPTVDTAIITQLADGIRFTPPFEPARSLDGTVPKTPASKITRVVITPENPAALDQLQTLAYPDFGLFIWKNARAFISVRCGPIGGNGLGAHAHNDQLAVEIEIDGVPYARDPGSFIYTPDLAMRNAYRSAHAHFVPRQGGAEPARLDLGPFRLEDRAQAYAARFAETEFVGSHQGFGETVWRRVLVGDGAVVIEDCWGGALQDSATILEHHLVRSPAELAALWGNTLPFSPAYGRQSV